MLSVPEAKRQRIIQEAKKMQERPKEKIKLKLKIVFNDVVRGVEAISIFEADEKISQLPKSFCHTNRPYRLRERFDPNKRDIAMESITDYHIQFWYSLLFLEYGWDSRHVDIEVLVFGRPTIEVSSGFPDFLTQCVDKYMGTWADKDISVDNAESSVSKFRDGEV